MAPGVGDLSASVTNIVPISASLTGAGSLSANTNIYPIIANLTGTGDLSATLGATLTPIAATLTSSGSLSATVQPIVPIAASITGSGDLSVTLGAVTTTVAASLTGTGDLSAAPVVITFISASLSGSGDLSATVVIAMVVSATLSGSGDLAATVQNIIPIEAAFSGTGDLSATVTVSGVATENIDASLTGTGSLLVDVTIISAAVAPDVGPVGGSLAQFFNRRRPFRKTLVIVPVLTVITAKLSREQERVLMPAARMESVPSVDMVGRYLERVSGHEWRVQWQASEHRRQAPVGWTAGEVRIETMAIYGLSGVRELYRSVQEQTEEEMMVLLG